jgi:hypothetical protein
MFVETWILILIVAAIAAAIFVPMSIVMVREKREMAGEPKELPPFADH